VHSVPKHKFCIFYLSKVSEILRNTTKHHFGSNGDVSQLWYLEIVHSGSQHKFCILLPVEGSRNALKHSQTSIWVQGVERMLYNFGIPKHCIQSRNTSFASFNLSKICEMLCNTPKHHFGSNGVEWMLHNFGIPKQFIQTRKTSFSFFLPFEGKRNALKHSQTSFWVQWSRTDASQLRYPKRVHSVPKHKFCIFYLSNVSEIL
jgi:hypothetical protein